jgi:hypothetical protein
MNINEQENGEKPTLYNLPPCGKELLAGKRGDRDKLSEYNYV